MASPTPFSRSKLTDFLACQRRFQLRYFRQLPWPAMPIGGRAEAAQRRGQRFHQLIERHFLGLPVLEETIADEPLRAWWRSFQNTDLSLPEGRRHTEIGLTIPVGDQLLAGRFDLLIVGQQDGESFAHVYDWKTGQPRTESELRQDWQTRLYCAMLAEGGGAFQEDGRPPRPEHVAITYWHVTEPQAPVIIRYNRAWHLRNWAEIQALVTQISQKGDDEEWPLTDDWSHCRTCAYQTYCQRQEAGGPGGREIAEDGPVWEEHNLLMEPDLP
jgi:CRISPR/Cas system-associated exonuclease Cas4 (RecB family)